MEDAHVRQSLAYDILDLLSDMFAPMHLTGSEQEVHRQVYEWTSFRKDRKTRDEWAQGSKAMCDLMNALSRKFRAASLLPQLLIFPIAMGLLLVMAHFGHIRESVVLGSITALLLVAWNEEVQNSRARNWALKLALEPLCFFVSRRNGEGLTEDEKTKLQGLCQSFMKQHHLNQRRWSVRSRTPEQ